jgi:hypothetical protein
MQAKFGTHFACYQVMFDHAKHSGNQYLKGHCFVVLSISIPVAIDGKIQYLNIPVGFRLRGDEENKLTMASKMVDTAMDILVNYPKVILLCDSWYPKGDILNTVKKHTNLELIANVRADSSLFDLPPMHTGKRGRPAKKGKKLNIHTDFHFIGVGDYFIAVRTVLTNLFEKLPVYLTVTTPDILNHNAYRVFICTILPEQLIKQFKGYESKLSDTFTSKMLWTFPLFLYSFRWPIEIFFYEQKTFWSFGLYRLRSKTGIENFVNFSSICYACMKMLPHMNEQYSSLINESSQSCKYIIGQDIQRELFLRQFVSNSESGIISSDIFDELGLFEHTISQVSHR